MTQAKAPAFSKTKTRSLPLKVAIVTWVDLLGYGEMIGKARFNPIDPLAKAPIARLRAFHRLVAEHSHRNYRTLVLNDGAVAYRDLSLRGSDVTIDFLARTWGLFEAIQELEVRNNYPGARMILAVGFRSKGSRRAIDNRSGHVGSIMARFEAGEIDAVQAIQEAASIQSYFDVLPQLQANFAFTKAYLADADGSRAGLPGPGFYVDDAIFAEGLPDWIESSHSVDWKHSKLDLGARFQKVTRVSQPSRVPGDPCGLSDGLGVAAKIAPTVPLLETIRELRAQRD